MQLVLWVFDIFFVGSIMRTCFDIFWIGDIGMVCFVTFSFFFFFFELQTAGQFVLRVFDILLNWRHQYNLNPKKWKCWKFLIWRHWGNLILKISNIGNFYLFAILDVFWIEGIEATWVKNLETLVVTGIQFGGISISLKPEKLKKKNRWKLCVIFVKYKQ